MDKSISDAVEMLYKGAKMLSQHCLDCKMPLFKHEDKIICPSCKKEFKMDENGNVKPLTKKIKNNEKINKKEENIFYKTNELNNILKNKLYFLIKEMENCNDINKLEYYICLSLKLIDLIERLSKL